MQKIVLLKSLGETILWFGVILALGELASWIYLAFRNL